MSAIDIGALGIRGNTLLQERLFRYLSSQRLHPAIIFSGPKSESKLAIAKNGARMLFCREANREIPFCGACSECSRIDREIHPDVWVWREPLEEIIKIETVRDICQRMLLSPIEGSCRICIIDDCHRMNAASANAFLKTLEEPSANHHFWLLTSQLGSLLPTLRSRCLEFSCQPEPPRVAERDLEFETLYQDFRRSKDPFRVTHKLREKQDVIAFVHFLQRRLRQSAIPETQWGQLSEWDRLLTLEGQLRSNASYALLLENFLYQNL